MGLKFPPEGDAEAAEAHVISSLRAPMGHMMLAAVRRGRGRKLVCLVGWLVGWDLVLSLPRQAAAAAGVGNFAPCHRPSTNIRSHHH
jgi:hypothetical protein